MTITLTVAGRIATVDATTHVVAGNTYPVTLSLDSEWTGSLYLRVRFGSLYYDIPFASSAASVDVQMPVGYPEVGIGVFSEALEICTSEARVRLLRSILEAGEQVVEFDSDLYDQWAGEVTTLLTDDAFDAESTRPLQNAVLTAWKDTVPVSADLVHKAGAETITGAKTFTSDPKVTRSTALLTLESTQASSAVAWKGRIVSSDQHNGLPTAFADILFGNLSAGNYVSIRAMNPSRDGTSQALAVYNHGDHMSVQVTAPYYPVDGSSNPQPLPATHVVTSGNIAVDPRIVHTTGNESIAGNKTLSGTVSLYRADPTLNLKSTTTTAQTGVKANIVFYTNNTVRGQVFQQRDDSSEFIALRQQKLVGSGFSELRLRVNSSDVGWAEAPSYTADNSADAKIVTRAMLATTPTVVHTTGAETIAGNKTFSGTATFNGHIATIPFSSASGSTWRRAYVLSPNSTSSGAVYFTAYSYRSAIAPAQFACLVTGGAEALYANAVNNAMEAGFVLAKRVSDGKVEVWVQKSYSVWQVDYYASHAITAGDGATSDTAPVVGEDYSIVVSAESA